MKLKGNMMLFWADVIDVDTQRQYFYYVVGRNEETAFKIFTKQMNRTFRTYDYYFHEIEDEKEIQAFSKYSETKAGTYSVWRHYSL